MAPTTSQDVFAQLHAEAQSAAPSGAAPQSDVFAQIHADNQASTNPAEQKGFLAKLWDKVNTPVADFVLPKGMKTSDILGGIAFEKMFNEPFIPGVNDFDTKAQVQLGDSPTKAAVKTFLAGSAKDTTSMAASLTSPLSLGTLALGAAAKTPGAVGTLSKALLATESAGLATKGTSDVVSAGTEDTPEAWQERLQGGAMIAGGAAGVGSYASPAIRNGWRVAGNPFGLASTGGELLTQGISPRSSLLGFKPALQRAAGDLAAYNITNPIQSVQDLNDAIPQIKQTVWNNEVEPALQRQASEPVDMKPVADAVRSQVSDEMRTFDESNAEQLDGLADKLDSARDVSSANNLLKYINGRLESYFQKFPAAQRANLMNNPETAGWEAARAELRDQFLSTLESQGEDGVRDARLRYGALDTLQDAVERRVNVADRAKPMSLGRIVGLVGAVPTGGLSVLAGELSNYLNKPDVLVRRGINNLPDTSAAPAAPAGPQPSTVLPATLSLQNLLSQQK